MKKVFHIGDSTASLHLSHLEELGLIERLKHGRRKSIHITELGEGFIPD
ncbi:MAG: DUF6293 family protein [Promethearchaeota archaeon]